MNLQFINYNKEYLEKCANEFVMAFSEKPWNEDWTINEARLRISEIMENRLSRGFLCVDMDSNKVVGLIIGRIMSMLDFKEFWIDDFSVLPSIQGQRVGTRLLEFAEREVKKEFTNLKTINLVTRKGYDCYQFYLNKGFVNDNFNTFLYKEIK